MTKKHSAKRALIASVLSLLLCISMLIGTTFAWFTDSVTSANNIIKSGNLDVELYYQAEGQSTWTKVTESTNVFKAGALWEPGYTEVVKLKVVNEGSLALKYQLGVNVASEVGSVNVNEKEFKLSEFIKFGIVDGAQTYTRDTAIAAVEDNATALKTAYKSTVIPLEAKNDGSTDEKIITMVVYMPTTVGNEANHKKDAVVPTINLGINLFATQYTAESDSFDNQYDVNAPFSVWNGVVPTEMPESLVVDGATQTVHVKDAAAFVYLSNLSNNWANLYTDGNGREYSNYANGAGADYYYSGKWTVSLEADIDLNNRAIEPIKLVLGESTGASAFKGNDHTIRNINTTTGLFADGNRASYADLTLVNVTATNGALTGSANTNISNVTVQNASISGTDYVGGLVGYIYGNVTDCAVIDSSVIATGKEAGGLIGYVVTSATEGFVTSNAVRNVSVYAGNRAAGLAAQVNVKVKVFDNVIDSVTVGAADTSTYQPDAVVSNALDAANVYDNTVNNANIAASKIEIASNETEFKDALKNATSDSTVILADDISVNGKWDNRFDGGKQNVPVTIEGCGKTLKIVGPIDDAGNQQAVFYFQNDAVVKNLTFDLSEATSTFQGRVRAIAAKGDLVVDNCTFIGNPDCTKGNGITYGMGSGAAIVDVDVTVTNCTFIDLPRALYDNENGKDAKTLTFKDNKFVSSGINVSAGESITFTGNELIDSSVRLVSYQNGATVKVIATGNDVSASAGNVIAIMKVTNTANITKQDEFILY